ncbi:hypothetical protein SNE40_016651 [Patella caerulea]|uniref:G-protein coupled receptors family 2 profile 2 domain-containing protein n=1 Tax=Patella caerulea TaxID=87958 RepID=A0AAN8JBY4_PATCE
MKTCIPTGICFEVPAFRSVPITNCTCWLNGFGVNICADFLVNNQLNRSSSVTINDLEGDITNTTILRNILLYIIEHSNCRQIHTTNDVTNITIIDTCPNEYQSSPVIKHLCETSEKEELPLVDVSAVTFRNIHCAFCHGLEESKALETLNPWTAEILCENDTEYRWDDIEFGLTKGTCEKSFTQPQIRTSFCHVNFRQILDTDCRVCLSVLRNGEEYTNEINCMLCRFSVIVANRCGTHGSSFAKSSLTNLFKLPNNLEVQVKINGGLFKASDICKNNENFDILFQKCREFVCSFGKYAKKGECHANKTIYVSPDSQPVPEGSDTLLLTIPQTILSSSKENIRQLRTMTHVIHGPKNKTRHKILLAEFMLKTNGVRLEDFLDLLGTLKFNTRNVAHSPFLFLSISNQHNLNMSNSTCLQWSFQCFAKAEIHFLKQTMYAKIEHFESNRTLMYPVNNVYFDLAIHPFGGNFTFHEICVCAPSDMYNVLNCTFPLRKYYPTEYNIDDKGMLKILGHQLEFKEHEYYTQDEAAYVCYSPNETRSFFKLDHVQRYISLACSVLSIVCLIVTVILSLIFEELRTLPGKLTIGVSVSLIFGQGLLLVPDLGSQACKYIAALTHYSWLSAFSWMSCQSINMFLTFQSSNIQNTRNAFKKYLLVCLLIPLTIIVVCFVMDTIAGDHMHVRYGLISCSWMADTNGYIFAFFIPVGLSLVVNSVCFALTLYSIEKTMTMSQKITGRQRDKKRCLIYIKLSSVMGFTWVFGFIASFLNVKLLWYVYIILNGLQGVFIFLSFGLNTRTRKRLAERMSTMRISNMFSSELNENGQSKGTQLSVIGD